MHFIMDSQRFYLCLLPTLAVTRKSVDLDDKALVKCI